MAKTDIRKIADFILGLQDQNGMIRDAAGAELCNLDSNMEYALMGLAAAYKSTGDARYLTGFQNGIGWLAGRIEMKDAQFKGSFAYAYETTPPYAPHPVSPGAGILDVRGVDATSALFVHLLALDRELTGSRALADRYSAEAHAALDFLLRENRAEDGFFYSSWQRTDLGWQLWRYEYAADQGDVYLGFRAGADLYEQRPGRYAGVADFLMTESPRAFFSPTSGHFGVGREGPGGLDSLEGINGVFAQGYLGWIMGRQPQAMAALDWLLQGLQADGRPVLFPGDPGYALSAEVLAMAAQAMGESPGQSLRWLTDALMTGSGGISDSLTQAVATSNIAGFALLALTAAPARADWQVSAGGRQSDDLTGRAGKHDVLLGFAGADHLAGAAKGDVLVGGRGADVLTGGRGADAFVFTRLSDSPNAAQKRDVITDFHHGRDRIDLSALDADLTRAGDQAFAFVGFHALTAHPGELALRHRGEDIRVILDRDGDGRAEFAITLTGQPQITAGDFLL